jgi:adenosylcobyric acid synthase
MPLLFLIGGARSGKSELAQQLASEQPQPVTVIATGEARDHEMRARIERHKRGRPPSWTTIEEPLRLVEALRRVDEHECAIVDCLTLWTANMLEQMQPAEAERKAVEAAALAAARPGLTIAVSNEVGLGLVPANELGRSYRDLLGSVNSAWSEAAAKAYLLVAGRPLELTRMQLSELLA